MTTFALLCDRCGLSHREAAEFLRVRRDTIKSWSSGRNPVPDGVIDQLRDLYSQIENAAAQGLAQIEKLASQMGDPDAVELGLASTDAEAQTLGFPAVGAHAAALGIIAARADVAVEIVPRGSTKATRLAVKHHKRMEND